MPDPIVSVIVPTYKRTDYLKLTLESILSQTFQDFEIIVVDDGTPNDDNYKLCRNYDKIVYLKIDNSGTPGRPRNFGIRKARGKYLAFVDDDDIWLPQKLEKQVAVLENNPDFGLVHCCCEVIDENGKLQNKIVGRPGSPDVKHGDVSLKMTGSWTIMMPTPLVRKEVIEKAGFFKEDMAPGTEDVIYWSRCSFETLFYYLDDPLVHYRVHSQNMSANKGYYRKVPYNLKQMLLEKRSENRISAENYRMFITKMSVNQIIDLNLEYRDIITILSELDNFWFLRPRNLNALLFRLRMKE